MATKTVAMISPANDITITEKDGLTVPEEDGGIVIVRTDGKISAYQLVTGLGLYKVELDEETLLKLALLGL